MGDFISHSQFLFHSKYMLYFQLNHTLAKKNSKDNSVKAHKRHCYTSHAHLHYFGINNQILQTTLAVFGKQDAVRISGKVNTGKEL